MRKLFFILLFIAIALSAACSDKKNSQSAIPHPNTTIQASGQSQYIQSKEESFDVPFAENSITSTIKYPNVNIYYEDSGIIYSYNPNTKENKEIINGYSPLLSHDKTKFVYFSSASQKNASEGSYFVYNISTTENKFLLANTESPNFQYEMWSPDDKYIVFDTGTDVHRSKIIYDAVTGSEILNIAVVESHYDWINNNEIVYTGIKAFEPESPGSLSVIDIKTKVKKDLMKGEKNIGYSFISILKNQKIYFVKYDRNQEDLSMFYTIDLDGNNSIKVKETHGNMEYFDELRKKYNGTEYPEFQSVFLDSLNEKDSNKYYIMLQQLQPASNWGLLIVDSPNRVYKYPSVFVLDKNNPKSLRKIGTFNNAQW